MKVVVDTCTLINLLNSGCYIHLRDLEGVELCIGDIVFNECETIKEALNVMLAQKILTRVSGDEIPLATFAKLVSQENFGEGEAECIAVGEYLGCKICTDDGKARKFVIAKYGRSKLLGSIGLIRQCYAQGLKSKEQAFRGYKKMKTAGAFLPSYGEADFENILNASHEHRIY